MERVPAGIGSAVFFCAAPGVVAGLPPWLLTGWTLPPGSATSLIVRASAAAVAVLSGLVVLVGAFVRFVCEGRGTPAPIAPTDQLVIGGTFRFVRNPMYVAVITILLGQTLLFGSWTLLVCTLLLWAGMAAFVRWYEEPVLTAQYAHQYEDYRRNVHAWWPRRTPWSPGTEASPTRHESRRH